MPTTTVSSFGSSSFLSAAIVTDTNSPTSVALAFLPTADRVRKARLAFDIAGADGFEITIEFKDERFEEFTVFGQRKGEG